MPCANRAVAPIGVDVAEARSIFRSRAKVWAMRIAYLVNQYPKISHVFIRREILAVEREGCEVMRCSLRRTTDKLIDPLDREEARKTHTVLDAGWAGLLQAMAWMFAARFALFWRALWLAIRVGWRSDRGLWRHVVYLAEACVLVRWLARDKIQHVHAHFGTNSTTVAMLCHRMGGPTFSFTAHGPEEFDKALSLGLGEKIARASFVAAISSYGRSQLYRRCDFRYWSNIKVVRCGVDDDFLGPAPAPMRGARRLVSIGRLCEQKGQLLLVEAMARLRREGREVDLVLIGDGVLRGKIEAAIKRNDLERNVRILGWADGETIRRTLDESCAFVLPSFAEGLPVVIMEALARARPVLSTFVAGIPELVVPGRNGWLVPAGSVDALVDSVRQILDAPLEQLAEMGLRGREDVRRQHAIEDIARGMVAHFRATIEDESSITLPTPA
jgi:glycosyltransferase involved in cell wall biosynthesis